MCSEYIIFHTWWTYHIALLALLGLVFVFFCDFVSVSRSSSFRFRGLPSILLMEVSTLTIWATSRIVVSLVSTISPEFVWDIAWTSDDRLGGRKTDRKDMELRPLPGKPWKKQGPHLRGQWVHISSRWGDILVGQTYVWHVAAEDGVKRRGGDGFTKKKQRELHPFIQIFFYREGVHGIMRVLAHHCFKVSSLW